MRRLLEYSRPLRGGITLEPITFERFAEAVGHGRRSAPGPDGAPYTAWACNGEAGALALYKACLATISRATMPDWLSSSLLVFIPKTSPGAPGQPHDEAPASFRPIALSNTAQKVLAKAINITLEEIAQQVVNVVARFCARASHGGQHYGDDAHPGKSPHLGSRRCSTSRRRSRASTESAGGLGGVEPP